MDIRKRLKEICAQQGITQKKLADELGITDISLNKTLRGGYPRLQTLEQIANKLGVEVWELMIDKETIIREARAGFVCPKCGARLRLVVDEQQDEK